MVSKKYTDDEFESLISQYDYKFQKGDLVKGIVCGYDSEGVIVDMGAKTSALVPEREARADLSKPVEQTLEKNSVYEFLIVREEDDEGRFLLSYKKVAMAYAWKEIENLKANDETIEGVVVSVVKGGVLVEVKGVRGFVPSSHLRAKDTENIIGEKIELKILSLDIQQNNFILSNKKVYSDSQDETKENVFTQLEVGQVVKGEVVRITDFGAFIDIGGMDGLLPLSQMSWRWVDHPSDVLKISDRVNVEIIGIDHDKQRVSLSLKNLEADPWIEAKNKIKEGDIAEGTITRIKHFGAFVEVFASVEALLPNSDIVEYQNKNSCILNVGDKIKTKIIKFNPDDRRISLSLEISE
jgi:ribosomal protein S1